MLPKRNLTNILESDECYTPSGVVKYIFDIIPKNVRCIWCPFDTADSNIVKDLQEKYDVIYTHKDDEKNFFIYQPISCMYDCIISNPSYRYKTEVLKRLYELKKPFFMLLPITTLEGRSRYELYSKYGINVRILANRVNFTGGKGAWFNTSWFYRNIGYSNRIDFVNNKEENNEEQFKLF